MSGHFIDGYKNIFSSYQAQPRPLKKSGLIQYMYCSNLTPPPKVTFCVMTFYCIENFLQSFIYVSLENVNFFLVIIGFGVNSFSVDVCLYLKKYTNALIIIGFFFSKFSANGFTACHHALNIQVSFVSNCLYNFISQ